jgi:transcriptional regulator with XRE-family HTH domain
MKIPYLCKSGSDLQKQKRMKEIVKRIQMIQTESGLDKKSFAEKINISAASLSHIHTGRNNPSLELVLNILKAYQDISAEWLLLGKGAQLKGKEPEVQRMQLELQAPKVEAPVESRVSEEEVKQMMLKLTRERKREFENRLRVLRMLMEEHTKSEMDYLNTFELDFTRIDSADSFY